ncbi:MAG: hypothetical protein J1E34_10160, partial [Oscillospiraceae bacterium]|nr:hypothetical protein [Oscillospiraceae bacterium]
MKKTVSVILVICCVAALFCGCQKPEQKIIGTWNGSASLLGIEADYSFTFNEDGTGKMSAALDIGVQMTYTITADTISITTSILGIDNTKDYGYSFGKNTL